MTHNNRSIIAPCLLAAALLSGCQNTKKPEDESVQTTTATKTSSTTPQVVMTPVEVEVGPTAEPESAKTGSGQAREDASGSKPASTPSSEYAADRIREMEKGLRRLQSLPSATPKEAGRARGKFDL